MYCIPWADTSDILVLHVLVPRLAKKCIIVSFSHKIRIMYPLQVIMQIALRAQLRLSFQTKVTEKIFILMHVTVIKTEFYITFFYKLIGLSVLKSGNFPWPENVF